MDDKEVSMCEFHDEETKAAWNDANARDQYCMSLSSSRGKPDKELDEDVFRPLLEHWKMGAKKFIVSRKIICDGDDVVNAFYISNFSDKLRYNSLYKRITTCLTNQTRNGYFVCSQYEVTCNKHRHEECSKLKKAAKQKEYRVIRKSQKRKVTSDPHPPAGKSSSRITTYSFFLSQPDSYFD
jgi:hypothetical protein